MQGEIKKELSRLIIRTFMFVMLASGALLSSKFRAPRGVTNMILE